MRQGNQSKSVGESLSNRLRILRMSVSRMRRERFLTVYWLQYLSNARISLSFNKIDTLCLRGDGLVCSFLSAFIYGMWLIKKRLLILRLLLGNCTPYE